MNPKISEVKKFQTPDGEIFETIKEAEEHLEKMDVLLEIKKMLESDPIYEEEHDESHDELLRFVSTKYNFLKNLFTKIISGNAK